MSIRALVSRTNSKIVSRRINQVLDSLKPTDMPPRLLHSLVLSPSLRIVLLALAVICSYHV